MNDAYATLQPEPAGTPPEGMRDPGDEAAELAIRHYDAQAERTSMVDASPRVLFDYLDDQRTLGRHMEKRSWRTLGASMWHAFDETEGRAVGSRIQLTGDVVGYRISVDEIVIKREAPLRKQWATIGKTRLVVVGPYRMGFEIASKGERSRLTVELDYQLPRWRPRSIAAWIARRYAQWCVDAMASDAAAHFARGGRFKR